MICLLYPFAAHKPIIAAAAAVTVYAVIGWAYDVKRKYSGAYGFFALFMICALGYELGRTNGGTAAYIAAAVLMILMFGVYIFPKTVKALSAKALSFLPLTAVGEASLRLPCHFIRCC